MFDEYFDRPYQSGRAQFHAGLDRGIRRISETVNAAFGALHRVQFSAPWDARRTDVGCA